MKNKKKKNVIDKENLIRFNPSMEEGLNDDEVNIRKQQGLINKKNVELSKSFIQIVFSNLFTFFNILLFSIAIVLLVLGQYTNCFFLVIVLSNLFIGIFQEYRAKKKIDSLKLLTTPTSGIVRNGKEQIVNCDEIVLDDVVFVSAGKEIPVDGIILGGNGEVNESLLTGESVPLKKKANDKVYAGSFVSSGTLYLKALNIGDETYISKLQKEAKKQKKVKSILLTSLNKVIRYISYIIIPLGAFQLINALIQHEYLTKAIASTAGSMVAMIPSGLFLLTSVTLYVSVIELASKNAYVQELYSIESLARVNVLCLDKTGTLTDGSMHLTKVVMKDENDFDDIISSFLYAFKEDNVTSIALKRKYNQKGKFNVIATIPFSSDKKYSAVTLDNNKTYFLGAPEYLTNDQNVLNEINEELIKGNRVLLFTSLDAPYNHDLCKETSLVGYFVLEDHIRDDAFDTVKWFQDNNVELRVISGDNKDTVASIANKVGILNADKAISLENMPIEKVKEIALDYRIFGRVNPEQKAAIISTLREHDKTVAMTGDGVNDILALKQANCSIAMASGSEAARNCSHIVLMDSSFSSMPRIVCEGRKVINNIQYSSSLFLMKTIYSIGLAILVLILAICQLGVTYPFEPRHLYIIEFAVIGIPSVFLALQPNTKLVEGDFFKNILLQAIPGGVALLLSACLTLYVFKFIPFFKLNDDIVITVSCLALSITGLVVLGKMCFPFNKYRLIIYIAMLFTSLVIIFILPSAINGINYKNLNGYNILAMLCSTFIALSVYFFLVCFINKKVHTK